MLTHSWPSSFLELIGLAERLASPSAHDRPGSPAFDVVVPSLPGFAYSRQRPQLPARLATHELWHELIGRRDSYGAHGGDLGAGITTRLGRAFPDSVAGIHVLAVAPPERYDQADLSDAERQHLAHVTTWTDTEGVYSKQQSTRPMTLSYGLSDSPVGLLGWILEKYRAWSDVGGDVFPRFIADEILTQVSLYWLTNTIATSFRPYYEHTLTDQQPVGRVEVPTAVAVSRATSVNRPESGRRAPTKHARYTALPRGGHFAAHEEPDLLADDIREFFSGLTWP